jgi:hypothetical protein
MKRERKLRIAGAVAALLTAALVLSVFGWAQGGDTPIVILDGSLSIQSAVPWAQFTGAGDQKAHPHTAKSVTQVALTVAGKNQTIAYSGEACRVDVTYAGDHIVFATGGNGKGLSMRPFGAFHPGSDEKVLQHNNQNAKISHVTITKGSATVFDADANGGTKITISYR